MDRWIDGQIDRWIDRQMDIQIDGQIEGQIDGQNRQIDGWIDTQIDRLAHFRLDRFFVIATIQLYLDRNICMDRQIDIRQICLCEIKFRN